MKRKEPHIQGENGAVNDDAVVADIVSNLDASADDLDKQTLDRLHLARQAALAKLEQKKRPVSLWWMSGAVTASFLAALLWFNSFENKEVAPQQIALDDFEWLLNDSADLDIVENELAFYDWADDTLSNSQG